MLLILVIAVVGTVLAAYALFEKRVAQRPCPGCGFRVSIDGLEELCPKCGSIIPTVEHLNKS